MSRGSKRPYVLEDRESGNRRLPTQEEASVGPAEMEDSIEDIIFDLIAPEKLSAKAVGKLSEYVQRCATYEDKTPAFKARIRAIISHLRPRPAELVDRWAFNYVMDDPSIQGLPQGVIAEMLGVERSTTCHAIRKWEKILGFKVGSFRSQGQHLRARTLRRKAKA